MARSTPSLEGGGAGSWSDGTGRLAGEHYEPAIRYALGLPGVCSANIGARSAEEVEQAVRCVAACRPLAATEEEALLARGEQFASEWKPMYGEPVA